MRPMKAQNFCWNVPLLLGLLASGCSDSELGTSSAAGFRVTASGEALAQAGYAFPPASGQEVVVADGWELEFERVLVVLDHIGFSKAPDTNPSNPAETGAVIAELEGGPFVVDLSATGAGTAAGKRSGERAWVLGEVSRDARGDAFDASRRYAFGFSFVPADDAGSDATFLGIDAEDDDWQEMADHGYTHFLIGRATRQAEVEDCETSTDYDFASLPTKVEFRLGFVLPTSSVNCQNPELTGQALEGEESQRGVQGQQDERVDVQVTVHTDHLFWNTVEHGALPLFNHLAARAGEVDSEGIAQLTNADLEGAPLAPAEDTSGAALGWMSCIDASSYTLPATPAAFTVDRGSESGIGDLADFLRYNAATMGHLNQDGLCYVEGYEHDHEDGHQH